MTSEPSSPSSAAFVPKRLVYRTRTAAPWRQVIKVCTLGVCCVTLGYTVSTLYTTGDPSCALMPVPQDVSYTMLTAGVGRAGDSADPGEYRRSHQGTLVGDHPHYSVPHRERPGDPPKHSLYDKVSNTVSIFNPWTKDKQPSADAKNATVDKESLYRGLSSAEENREDVAQAHHTNPERPRIGKVTILTGEDNQIYERAIRTHELHNRLHGYSLHTLRESLLNDVWSKPAYILSVLLREMAKPKAERLEWLFWVDADTIILNPYIPAEIFLPPAGWDDTHLMVCHDYNGLNNGIFLIRVHSWSVELLSVIVSYPYWKPGAKLTFRDQSAMADVLTTPKFAKHTVKAPQRWFNAYQGEVNETIAPFQVRRGDLLVHFAGVPDRAQRMELWLQRVEEHNPEWEVELKYTSYPTEVKDYWWEMGQLRDTRRKELAGARKVAENLRDQVQEQLREYQDRMEENPKKRIEHELEHMETILDDKYMGEDVEQLNRTVKILKEVSQPLQEFVKSSNKAVVKDCHDLLFKTEQTTMTNPATPLTQVQFTEVEESISTLKDLLLMKPINPTSLRNGMDKLKNKHNALLDRMADIKAKEEERKKAKMAGQSNSEDKKGEAREDEEREKADNQSNGEKETEDNKQKEEDKNSKKEKEKEKTTEDYNF